MNGKFRQKRDVLALRRWRKERVEHQSSGIRRHHHRIGHRPAGVIKPLRSPFGHSWMIDMRPIWRRVRREMPVDEAMAVRPGRPSMNVLRRQHRRDQKAC
jgi:hypothetical protein